MLRPVLAMTVPMVWGVSRATSYTEESRNIQNAPPQNFTAQDEAPESVG